MGIRKVPKNPKTFLGINKMWIPSPLDILPNERQSRIERRKAERIQKKQQKNLTKQLKTLLRKENN
tara:strand:- start:112 stop:309 length:198 start_codon:yes stop_codon:yes gene_type:complete